MPVGRLVGLSVGSVVGLSVGSVVGLFVGRFVGWDEVGGEVGEVDSASNSSCALNVPQPVARSYPVTAGKKPLLELSFISFIKELY